MDILKLLSKRHRPIKTPDTVRRVFEIVHPDLHGYTFFSVTVWEGNFNVMNSKNPGWTADMRILEARYVIFGSIIYHITDCAELNGDNKKYNHILDEADDISKKWMAEFRDFQQKYRRFWLENPRAGGCRWNRETKQVYE